MDARACRSQQDVDAAGSEDDHVAHNYHPLEVVVAPARVRCSPMSTAREYLDFLAAYSATNFGHGHPASAGGRAAAAAPGDADLAGVPPRSARRRSPPSCAALIGKEMVLPMNTGAEAVESGIKVARKWGYEVKGVPDGRAKIIVAAGNFHGRTTTIISFSDDPDAHDHYGPYTPGFVTRALRRSRGAAQTRSTTTSSRCCWSRSRVRPAC